MPLLMTVHVQERFSILIINLVVLPISISLPTALLILLIFLPLLLVLGWLLREGAKDAKHLAIVEKAGGDFIPLVVESFGIWTLFAWSVLHSIADRTTTCSGISLEVARRNLLQQLSVRLWLNNA